MSNKINDVSYSKYTTFQADILFRTQNTNSITFYDDFMEMYDFSQWLKDYQAGLNDLDE